MSNPRAKHIVRDEARAEASPTKGKTEKKPRDERWRELLKAAAQVFAKKGYKSTSLQDLADEIGILKGSLYYYIDSKEDLLYELVHGILDGGIANLRSIASGGGDALTRLKGVITTHVEYLIENLAETTVFLHDIKHLSKERRETLAIDEYEQIIIRLIEEGQAEGTVRDDIDPRLIGMGVLGMVNWIYRWYRPGNGVTPHSLGTFYAEMVGAGIHA